MPWVIGIVVVVVLLGIWIVGIYNKLVKARNRVRDQWAQVDVHLKRRADLIPNLVETVKGYAKHESETLEGVIRARNSFVNAKGMEEEIKASGELTQAIGRLFAVAESYPDLKANTNFQQLQSELSGTEDKIAYARQFYNDTVLKYNNIAETFPSNVIAGMFGFKVMEFFKAEEAEKAVPKVSF